MILRSILLEFFKHTENLVRSNILTAETVTAAYDLACFSAFKESRAYIEIKRLTESTRLLRTFENSNFLSRLRQCLEEIFQ